jgi:hypothetical protein
MNVSPGSIAKGICWLEAKGSRKAAGYEPTCRHAASHEKRDRAKLSRLGEIVSQPLEERLKHVAP